MQIQFEPGGVFLPGDFWLIPARTATRNVEWPESEDRPVFRPPAGIALATAPLAFVHGLEDDQQDYLPVRPPGLPTGRGGAWRWSVMPCGDPLALLIDLAENGLCWGTNRTQRSR